MENVAYILRVFTNTRPLPCEMKAFCTKSQLEGYDIVVDKRCDENPWSRCVDEQLCPFGAIWKHWSLSRFVPEIIAENRTVNPIQT